MGAADTILHERNRSMPDLWDTNQTLFGTPVRALPRPQPGSQTVPTAATTTPGSEAQGPPRPAGLPADLLIVLVIAVRLILFLIAGLLFAPS